MYKIDFLIEIFLKHAEEADKNNRQLRKQFKEMYPKEPIPNHMKDEFSLPLALATICDCIRHLNERLKDLQKNGR